MFWVSSSQRTTSTGRIIMGGGSGGGRRQTQFRNLGCNVKPTVTSLYSLTINEVQNQLGQSFHGMNLQQFLRNVVLPSFPSQEDNQTLSLLDFPFPSSSSSSTTTTTTTNPFVLDLVREALSNNTIDEVWKDMIQQVENKGTLGETTLEDFLGMVVEGYKKKHRTGGCVQEIHRTWGTKKRVDMEEEEEEEKMVERRQERMIKNRESAARSRARKQAYTTELENKITRLEEENSRLKKQKMILQDPPLPDGPAKPVSRLLRRTSSSLF